jgi:hypothetical protein
MIANMMGEARVVRAACHRRIGGRDALGSAAEGDRRASKIQPNELFATTAEHGVGRPSARACSPLRLRSRKSAGIREA